MDSVSKTSAGLIHVSPAQADGQGETVVTAQVGKLVLVYVSERSRRGDLRGESSRTVRYTLGTFVQVVGWEMAPARLRPTHVEKWMARKPLSEASQRSQLSILRTFCRWLVRKGHTKTDITMDVRSPRQPRYVPRGIRHDAVSSTIGACPDSRAELIVTLEVQQGLRACEVVNLQMGDIDPDDRIMVVNGKGGHQRVLPITEETWAAINRYLAEHPASAGPLVRSYNHPTRGITAHYVSRLVSAWMHDAGVQASGHALRHTAATDMLRGNAHLRDVQNALGHQSLATTQRYLPFVVHDLREAMGGRSYRQPQQPRLFDVGRPERPGSLPAGGAA